jgi:hypothetical protein
LAACLKGCRFGCLLAFLEPLCETFSETFGLTFGLGRFSAFGATAVFLGVSADFSLLKSSFRRARNFENYLFREYIPLFRSSRIKRAFLGQ